MEKPHEFDRIRGLLVRYAERLQDKNAEPPGPFLLAHAYLQAVDMLDLLAAKLEHTKPAPSALFGVYVVRRSRWHWNLFFRHSVWSVGWPR